MGSFLPYGSVQLELESLASQELELMDDAISAFTDVVIEMVQVVEVAEMAEDASSPVEEAAVQEFVVLNAEALTIDQEEVDTYNQSLDDIETHANNASAYLAVAGNEDAVAFLDQTVEDANTTADQANIFYDANAQWLAMGTPMQRNLTVLALSGENTYGFDLYATEADILVIGSESEFYLTGPTAVGYKCFMTQEDCE
jgi:predicted GNAT family acetyltransferase